MTALGAAVLVLCTYRLTRLVTDDTLLEVPRTWLLKRAARREERRDPTRQNQVVEERWVERDEAPRLVLWVNRLVNCHWCVGIWAAAASTVSWRFAGQVGHWCCLGVAVAGAAGLLRERLA